MAPMATIVPTIVNTTNRTTATGRAEKGSHNDSASADVIGSPFGSPMSDCLCSAELNHSSAW